MQLRRYSRLGVSVVLFGVVLLAYTLPYRDWRLFDDDYVVLHGGNVRSLAEVGDFFVGNPNSRTLYPSNYRDDVPLNFFSVMYRPLTQVMHAVEVFFISPLNAQAHFWLTMALYAVAVVMVFNLFALFFTGWYALLGALVFAFYPCMGWIGRPAVQPYFVCLILLGGVVLLLHRGIVRQRRWLVWPAALLFLVAIFMQETTVAFPVWLMLAVPVFVGYRRQRLILSAEVLKESLWWVLPFVGVVLVNLAVRAITYPMVLGSSHSLFDPLQLVARLKTRLFDIVTLAVDSVGLTWISAGNRLRKGIALGVVLAGVCWLFMRSSRKREIVILVVGYGCLSWLSFVMTHQMRYIYLGIPCLIAAVLMAVSSTSLRDKARRRLEVVMVCVALVWIGAGAWNNYRYLKAFEGKARIHDDAHRKFFRELDPITKPICFVGVPQEWFAFEGTAQAVWLYRGSSTVPVYHDWLMNIHCYDCPTLLDLAVLPRNNLVEVMVTGNVVHLKSRDPQHAWIQHKMPFGQLLPCTMGIFTPLQQRDGKVFEATIKIDDRWYSPDMIFVTWDFEKQELVEVKHN